MNDMIQSNTIQLLPNPHLAELTFREWEILLLLSEDKSNHEIAHTENLKIQTIRTMRNRIGDKLFLKGRDSLGRFARQHRNTLRMLFPVLYPPR